MDISKINLEKNGMNAVVSELESGILGVLWSEKSADAHTIHAKIKPRFRVAHSTVAVYLDRLHSKRLVGRRVLQGRGGLRYVYFPAYSREELGNKLAEKFVLFLKKNFGEQSTAYLRMSLKK